MGWLVALGILVLLAMLPLGIRFRYNDAGAHLAACVGPIRISILPAKKKKTQKQQKQKKKQPRKEKSSGVQKKAESEKPMEKGGSWTDFLPLLKVVLDFLGRFLKKIRVDHLELKLILAGDDPCDLAVNYGKAWAAVGSLMPMLERVFTIRKRNVEVECDFMGNSTTVIAGANITISLGRLLVLTGRLAFRSLREYLKIKQKRKGGAAK